MAQHLDQFGLEGLIELLSHLDSNVRVAAAQSLGAIGTAATCAAPQLIELLRDGSVPVREAAIIALRDIGQLTLGIARLSELVKDPSSDVRKSAISVSRRLGADAAGMLDSLLDIMRNERVGRVVEDHDGAIDVIASLGAVAVLPLIELLTEEDDYIVCRACYALAQIGPAAAAAVPELTGLLCSDRFETWGPAAMALGEIGPAAKSAVPVLLTLLARNPYCDDFVDALGSIGPGAAEGIPLLIGLLSEFPGSDDLHESVAVALREIGFDALAHFKPAAIQATPSLIDKLLGEAPYYWQGDDICEAVFAICRIGVEYAVPRLLEVSVTSELSQAKEAMSVLERIGSAAVPALLAQAASSSHPGHWETVESVILSMGEEARPALLHVSNSSEPAVASHASRLLRLLDDEAEAESLAKQELTEGNLGVHATALPVTVEDERILNWFQDVDLTKYLTPLQLFWCIGCLEREAIESAGLALGWHRLARHLRDLNPQFRFANLPTGVTYLLRDCLPSVDGLLDREPFHSNAWSDAERPLELREESMLGKRPQGRWTLKARTALRYVDRFLTLRGLRPTITLEGD